MQSRGDGVGSGSRRRKPSRATKDDGSAREDAQLTVRLPSLIVLCRGVRWLCNQSKARVDRRSPTITPDNRRPRHRALQPVVFVSAKFLKRHLLSYCYLEQQRQLGSFGCSDDGHRKLHFANVLKSRAHGEDGNGNCQPSEAASTLHVAKNWESRENYRWRRQ